MKNIPFYIITSDATSFILKATCYLYNKYWNIDNSQYFKILGNSKPTEKLPDNFEFIKIKNENKIKHWTKHIYKFILENEKNDYFILTLDDYLPNRHLKINIFDGLISYAEESGKVGRIGLGWSPVRGYENIKKFDEYTIYRLNQNTIYRLVCQTSVWNREYLLKYFNHNWAPWDLEICGSKRAKNDGMEIIGAKDDLPFDWIEESALSSRWPGMINILGLQKEGLKYFIEEGIFKKESLQYGMWTEYKPPLFSEVGYDFKFDIIRNHLEANTFNSSYNHYKNLYESKFGKRIF